MWRLLRSRKNDPKPEADERPAEQDHTASEPMTHEIPSLQLPPQPEAPPPKMYEEFYRLKCLPFLTVPDPRFLYWSEHHQLAFSVLRYGLLTRAPITMVTGEIGAGKTTLLRHLLTEIPEDLAVGLISNTQAGRGELLHWVLLAFDLPFNGTEPHVVLFRQFQDFLIEAFAEGRRVVLILDEAQNLSPELLEELRLLSNINSDGNELLQLILVGQPNLRELVNRPELVQFAQRIGMDFNLETLSADETAHYINSRLECAGAAWSIFPDTVCHMICKATRGIPRLINVLCDLCLAHGFATERRVIDEAILREILDNLDKRGIFMQFDVPEQPQTPTLVRDAAKLQTRPLFRVKGGGAGAAPDTKTTEPD